MMTLRYGIFMALTMGFLWIIYDATNHILAEIACDIGNNHHQMGHFYLANEQFKQAVKYAPWEPRYQLELAKNYHQLANTSPENRDQWVHLALETYDALIQKNALYPWYYFYMGTLYHAQYTSNPTNTTYQDQALASFKLATHTDPNNALFTEIYADALYTYGKLALAETYYTITLSYDKDLVSAHIGLAKTYIKQQQPQRAIDYYEDVLLYIESQRDAPPHLSSNDSLHETMKHFNAIPLHLIDIYMTQPDQNALDRAWELIQALPNTSQKYEKMMAYYESVGQDSLAQALYHRLNPHPYTPRVDRRPTP